MPVGGPVTVSDPEPAVKERPTILWSMSKAWVTDGLRIITTEEIFAASGVCTWNAVFHAPVLRSRPRDPEADRAVVVAPLDVDRRRGVAGAPPRCLRSSQCDDFALLRRFGHRRSVYILAGPYHACRAVWFLISGSFVERR